jgi:hypothetical protein
MNQPGRAVEFRAPDNVNQARARQDRAQASRAVVGKKAPGKVARAVKPETKMSDR